MKRILYILALALSILACTDEIDKSNRFTFTGETVADFMLNRSDRYSHMITLFKRAGLFSLLNTYGQYTLFLPDNEAVEKFVAEQDSIYHATIGTPQFINTGITSPFVEDMSDSMANVLARTHTLEVIHRTANMGDGALVSRNFNHHFIGINYAVKGENYYIMLNNSAAIICGDNEVENGIVHLVDKVIQPTQKTVPELIKSCGFFTLFSAALQETHFCDSIASYIDITYNPDDYTPSAYTNLSVVAETKYYKYTGFVEPDEVFHKNGIYTLDDLKAFAEKWYGAEDKDDPKSPQNALYKFVAYHFVERELPYNRIIVFGKMSDNMDMEHYMMEGYDRYDYFETMHGKLMKVVKPLSKPEGIDVFVNYSNRQLPYNIEMHNHLNVRVIPLTEFIATKEEYALFDQSAMNGIVHPIDKILVYDEDEMSGNILNERLRFDVLSLLPELSCNDIRFRVPSNQGEYHVKIPEGYSKNLKIRNGEANCRNDYFGYFGDGLYVCKFSDISFRLPHVPERVYEIRFGWTLPIAYLGSIEFPMQMYVDNKIEGLPFDLQIGVDYGAKIGWEPDEVTYDNGFENDKSLRAKGYMKAPDVIRISGKAARNYYDFTAVPLRKIVTRKYLDGADHWIRFRYVGEYDYSYFLDYIELVPLHIVSDPTKSENRH